MFRISNMCALLTGVALTVVALVSTPAVAQLPLMGEQSAFNLEQERRIGLQFYRNLQRQELIETNSLIDGYINDLGDLLLSGLDNPIREYRFFCCAG